MFCDRAGRYVCIALSSPGVAATGPGYACPQADGGWRNCNWRMWGRVIVPLFTLKSEHRSVVRALANMSWESMAAMAVIGTMIVVMGNSQSLIHKMMHGKPKHPCHDAWDLAMERRDERILAEAKERSH